MRGTQNCQVMEGGGALSCVIHWETVWVQGGQECRGGWTSPRDPQAIGSDLSSTVFVPQSSGDVHFWDVANQSLHQRLKATEMRCLAAWRPEPQIQGLAGPPSSCGPRAVLPSCLSQLRVPAVHPLAQGCSLQFLPFLLTVFSSVSGSRRLLRTLFTGLRTQPTSRSGVPLMAQQAKNLACNVGNEGMQGSIRKIP